MEAEKRCWAVSAGEYSDRWILAVFTNKLAATLYRDSQVASEIAGLWADSLSIEELPLDPTFELRAASG